MQTLQDFLAYKIDTQQKLLSSYWLRPVSQPEVRQGLQHLVEVIHRHEIKHWLHHSKQACMLETDNRNWLTEVLLLLLVHSKLQQLAIVCEQRREQQQAAETLRKKIYRIFGTMIPIEFFPTPALATAWLLPQSQAPKLPCSGPTPAAIHTSS